MPIGVSSERMVRDYAPWAKTVAELRSLSDDDLLRQHDELVSSHMAVGVDYYLEELARRRAERAAQRMERLTVIIGVLTAVNVVAVLVDVL